MTSDEDLAEVRRSRSYRASIWLTRFNVVPFGLLLWLGPARGSAPGPLFFLIFLLLGVSIVTALALLRRSGVPLVRFGRSWRIRDPRVVRQIYRDVLWMGGS
jgi:hypothetical protein